MDAMHDHPEAPFAAYTHARLPDLHALHALAAEANLQFGRPGACVFGCWFVCVCGWMLWMMWVGRYGTFDHSRPSDTQHTPNHPKNQAPRRPPASWRKSSSRSASPWESSRTPTRT